MTNGWADYLDEGEEILWEGRPVTRTFLLSLGDRYRLILAGIWIVFLIFFFNRSVEGGAMVMVTFFRGLPIAIQITLILATAYFTVGRWLFDAHIRKHTVYAISNKRAFIAKSAFGRRELDHVMIEPAMDIVFLKGEIGSITFRKNKGVFRNFNKWGVEDGSFTFRGLYQPEQAFAVVEEVQQRARAMAAETLSPQG